MERTFTSGGTDITSKGFMALKNLLKSRGMDGKLIDSCNGGQQLRLLGVRHGVLSVAEAHSKDVDPGTTPVFVSDTVNEDPVDVSKPDVPHPRSTTVNETKGKPVRAGSALEALEPQKNPQPRKTKLHTGARKLLDRPIDHINH